MNSGKIIEPILRNFELQLLDILGYSIDFLWDNKLQCEIPYACNNTYTFTVTEGVSSKTSAASTELLNYKQLEKLSRRDFSDAETLQLTKKTNRLQIQQLLGSKKLSSRELYKSMFEL